jgi:hypothetical protein
MEGLHTEAPARTQPTICARVGCPPEPSPGRMAAAPANSPLALFAGGCLRTHPHTAHDKVWHCCVHPMAGHRRPSRPLMQQACRSSWMPCSRLANPPTSDRTSPRPRLLLFFGPKCSTCALNMAGWAEWSCKSERGAFGGSHWGRCRRVAVRSAHHSARTGAQHTAPCPCPPRPALAPTPLAVPASTCGPIIPPLRAPPGTRASGHQAGTFIISGRSRRRGVAAQDG